MRRGQQEVSLCGIRWGGEGKLLWGDNLSFDVNLLNLRWESVMWRAEGEKQSWQKEVQMQSFLGRNEPLFMVQKDTVVYSGLLSNNDRGTVWEMMSQTSKQDPYIISSNSDIYWGLYSVPQSQTFE